MARGFGAAESTLTRGWGSAYEFPKPVLDPKVRQKYMAYEKAAKMIFENPKVRGMVKDFLYKVSGHLAYEDRGKTNARETIKQMKLDAISIFKQLPVEIQNAIKVPDNMIDNLFRGVGDRRISEEKGWVNGKFVYGFSDNKKMAQSFVRKNGGKLVSSKDIKSFGGIISIEKLYELASKHNEIAWGDENGFMLELGVPKPSAMNNLTEEQAKNKLKEYEGVALDADNPFPAEREYLVYDIAFKKTGKKFYT